jgi:hypothetical protein
MALLSKTRSFATITGGLRKMVQDLRAYAHEKTQEVTAIDERISSMFEVQQSCLDEADASMNTADRIAELIGEAPTESVG